MLGLLLLGEGKRRKNADTALWTCECCCKRKKGVALLSLLLMLLLLLLLLWF